MRAAMKEWRSPGARSSACVLAILLAAVGLQGSSSSAAPCSGFGVTDISPAVGFVTGGTATTITGCGFAGAGTLTVKFGGGSPTTVTPASDTSLTATSPAAAAPGGVTVEVRLHPSAGTDSVATTTFTYVAKPAITKIAPARGPEGGGTSVHVKGSALTPNGSNDRRRVRRHGGRICVRRDRHVAHGCFACRHRHAERHRQGHAARRRVGNEQRSLVPLRPCADRGERLADIGAGHRRDRRHPHRHPFPARRPRPVRAVGRNDQPHGRLDRLAGSQSSALPASS